MPLDASGPAPQSQLCGRPLRPNDQSQQAASKHRLLNPPKHRPRPHTTPPPRAIQTATNPCTTLPPTALLEDPNPSPSLQERENLRNRRHPPLVPNNETPSNPWLLPYRHLPAPIPLFHRTIQQHTINNLLSIPPNPSPNTPTHHPLQQRRLHPLPHQQQQKQQKEPNMARKHPAQEYYYQSIPAQGMGACLAGCKGLVDVISSDSRLHQYLRPGRNYDECTGADVRVPE